MIREYALDPATLRSWEQFKYLAESFGMSVGRLISRYPKDWRKMAYQAIKGANQNDQKRLEFWLQHQCDRLMTAKRGGSRFESSLSWLNNAITEHQREPFDAIIADTEAQEHPPILNYRTLDRSDPRWNTSTQVFVVRNAAEVGKHVRPLLRHAQKIRFIDPYFSGNSDQIALVKHCLSCFSNCDTSSISSIEFVVSGEKVSSLTVANHLQPRLISIWPAQLCAPQIVRWQHKYLHNRFILTDRGGIMFGDSLREDAVRPDQLTLLQEDLRTHWWEYHDVAKYPERRIVD